MNEQAKRELLTDIYKQAYQDQTDPADRLAGIFATYYYKDVLVQISNDAAGVYLSDDGKYHDKDNDDVLNFQNLDEVNEFVETRVGLENVVYALYMGFTQGQPEE